MATENPQIIIKIDDPDNIITTGSSSDGLDSSTASTSTGTAATEPIIILPFQVTSGFERLTNELLKLGIEQREDIQQVILLVQDILYNQKQKEHQLQLEQVAELIRSSGSTETNSSNKQKLQKSSSEEISMSSSNGSPKPEPHDGSSPSKGFLIPTSPCKLSLFFFGFSIINN